MLALHGIGLRCSLALGLALASTSSLAKAQDIAPPENEERAAIKVGGQLGLSWATGNTKSFIGNAGIRSALRIDDHQLTFSGIIAHSSTTSAPEGTGPDGEEVRVVADDNVYGRLRYDHFFAKKNGVFAGFLGFRDPSSGFRARWMPYAGYLRTLAEVDDKWSVWIEGGYRAAYEHLLRDRLAFEQGLPASRWVHGPTAFLGAKVGLSKTVSLDVGAEVLGNVRNIEDVRVNSFLSLISFIAYDISFGATFNSRYLTEPIGDRENLDTSLQVVVLNQHTFKL